MAGFSYISQMIRRVGFFIFLSVCAACSSISEDDVSPILTSVELNDVSFSLGEVLVLNVSGSDNLELKQVRFKIREGFGKAFGFWELVEIRDLSGTTFTEIFSYAVPDSTLAGLYELSIQAADERGNGSVDSTLQFMVRQIGEEPSILDFGTNPPLESDGVLRIDQSDTLTFSGALSDSDTLRAFSIVFRDDLGLILQSVNYAVPDTTLFDLSTAPDSVFFGNFDVFPVEMELKVEDKVGHQRRETYAVEVE